MTEKKKRNIIIGSLCAVVLLMAVGYAAFQTVLNINGTSNISSNFNVKITGVTSKNVVGNASNNGNPTFTDTSATFKTNLVSPGDSLEYDITITNAGNLNAKLDKITLSDTSNPAIKFTSSGLTEGDMLNAGSTSTLTVKVEYLASVTSDPSSKSSSLTVDLDYSQAINGGGSDVTITTEDLKELAVTTGDGLYADTYENGRYIYKGANPSNYLTYNDEEWRIIAVEADGTLKIRRNGSIGNMAWDENNSNSWTRPATLNTYLNNDYYNTLSSDAQNQIQSHNYGIGSVTIWNNTDLAAQIASENGAIWTGNIGLISVSDYIRADTNTEQCGNLDLNITNDSVCKVTNYLTHSTGYYWTISSVVGDSRSALAVRSTGRMGYGNSENVHYIYPALYLKSDITLSGKGTQLNPYMIN